MDYTINKTNSESLSIFERLFSVNPKKILSVKESNCSILVSLPWELSELHFKKRTFEKVLKAIKKEIRSRPNPEDRVEYWETLGMDGVYSLNLELKLLKQRQRKTK